jgi:predicted peptidase
LLWARGIRKRGLIVLFRAATLFFVFLSSYVATVAQTVPPGVVKDEPQFRKRTFANKSGAKMPYRLFVPPGYTSDKKYPLIVWFHDGSGRGSNNEAQISSDNEKGTHLWTATGNQEKFPAFVLAPQCTQGENWSDPELNEIGAPLQLALDILALVEKDYSIDPARVHLIGQSMGGLGVWALLQKFPERWAAAIVVASYDNFTNVAAITRVPLWIFQGDADSTVPVDLVRQMVKQLKNAGGAPLYSEYHKTGHEVWNEAFANPQLVSWLAAQKRGTPDRTTN